MRRRQTPREQKAQLSLSLLEVAVGVLLVFAVLLGFVLGVPAPNTRDPQLEAYANDAITVLASEPPRHQGTTRLSEVARSPDAFERERDALEYRIDRLLPDNLMFRVGTPHGAVGYQVPSGVSLGTARVTTTNGVVTILVWYV
jgi:hypothetical protein